MHIQNNVFKKNFINPSALQLASAVLCLFFSCYPFVAQAQKDSLIGIMVKEIREKKYVLKKRPNLTEWDVNYVMKELDYYAKDTSEDVRNFVLVNYKFLYQKHGAHKNVNRRAVRQLLRFCRDTSYYIQQEARKLLLDFRERDFSQKDKKTIRRLIRDKKGYYDLSMLVGVAQIKREIGYLKEELRVWGPYCPKHPLDVCAVWDTHLALARLGDTASLNYCIKRINRLPDIEDRVLYCLSDLAYTRQPKAIAMVVEYLFTEGHVGYDYLDVEHTPYANYALDELTRAIEGFPVPFLNGSVGYTDEELLLARHWIKDNPNYKIAR